MNIRMMICIKSERILKIYIQIVWIYLKIVYI